MTRRTTKPAQRIIGGCEDLISNRIANVPDQSNLRFQGHGSPPSSRVYLISQFANSILEVKDFGKSKDILIYLVGTQSTPGIETMLDYMANKYHMPLTLVTFDVFQTGNGQRILVREISEGDISRPEPKRSTQRRTADVEKVCVLADQNGIGQEFRYIFEESKKLGFHFRPSARSIMFSHPDHKTRMLFTIWAHHKFLKAYVGYEAFVDYYPVTTELVAEALGLLGYRRLDMEQARQLVSGLKRIILSGPPVE